MDVCLTNYGHCNYVSGKHACIFYDEVRLLNYITLQSTPVVVSDQDVNCVCVFVILQNTKHYELLNYSEHGTTVDNVLYSCDFSEKTSPCPPGGLVAKVQGIIRKYISVICLDWLEGTQVCVPSLTWTADEVVTHRFCMNFL